jgi:hypothetical protein
LGVSSRIGMSRTEKLYQRLDALRSEFRKLLAADLEIVAKKGLSEYFYRYITPVPRGRSHRAPKLARLEELEEEITHLRKKLGEDAATCPTRYVHQFVSACDRAGKGWWDGQSQATAKRLLEELQHEIDTQQ